MQPVVYSDLDLNLEPHPVTGDVVVLTGHRAIDRSLRNIVYTNFHERPFHSDVGANLRAQTFELFTPMTAKTIEMNLRRAIKNDEPRADLISISINDRPDQNGVAVRIKYRPVDRTEPVIVDVFIRRIR